MVADRAVCRFCFCKIIITTGKNCFHGMSIRPCKIGDLLNVQSCNLSNLPENYQFKYYVFHIVSWPQLSYIAENERGEIVGYIMAKVEITDKKTHGHITSLAVIKSYRRLGIAEHLMKQVINAMERCFSLESVSLHVRTSNVAAISLYTDKLDFEISETASNYYANGEDAYLMTRRLRPIDNP